MNVKRSVLLFVAVLFMLSVIASSGETQAAAKKSKSKDGQIATDGRDPVESRGERVSIHTPVPPDSLVIADLLPEERFLISSDTRVFVEAEQDNTTSLRMIKKGAGYQIELLLGGLGIGTGDKIQSLVFSDDGAISTEPLRKIQTRDGKILLGDKQIMIFQDWFNGTEHTFLGDVRIGPYLFKSDRNFPLTFQVVKGKGYVYLCGRGTVQKDGGSPIDLGSKQSASDWVEPLSKGDLLQKQGAAQALGWYKDKKAIPALLSAAKDTSSWKVRRNAVEALGRIADPSAEKVLVEATSDENTLVRAVALEALAKIGKTGLPHIKKSLSDEKMRQTAIYALGASTADDAIQILSDLVNDKNNSIRHAAVKSLGRIAKPACLPILLDVLRNNSDGDSRAAAVGALDEFPGPQSTDAIFAALKDKDKNVRQRAVHAVAKLDDPRSLPTLKELAASDPNNDVKDAAKKVLKKKE